MKNKIILELSEVEYCELLAHIDSANHAYLSRSMQLDVCKDLSLINHLQEKQKNAAKLLKTLKRKGLK